MIYHTKSYKIISNKKITTDVSLIKIKTKINPQPGQFFQVSLLGVGEGPFASCSFAKNKKNELEILLRNVGRLTDKISQLKRGDKLFIRGPYGQGFPIKELQKKNLILVGGGTGIAPLTSLISYIEQNRRKFNNIEIYFGFKNKENILLHDRIKKWKKKFKLVLSLDNKHGLIPKVIEKHNPNIKNAVVLLCGPEAMMEAVTKKFNKIGTGDYKIFWSMERRMECGFGSCHRCMIQDLYVCRDGPIFRYDKLKKRLNNEKYANQKT